LSLYSVEPNEYVTYKLRHEDEHIVVVDKPTGTPSQPGLGHDSDTLLNGLFTKYGQKLQNLGKDRDFGMLHRLDRKASGLLIVALSNKAYDAMREQFMKRTVGKFYWVVVKDVPSTLTGVINRPIAESLPKGPGSFKRGRISGSGKEAVTAFRVLQQGNNASLVECRPVTGRLHQIRVHMELIGCPVLGDEVYSPPAIRAAAPRLALHSHRVVFTHPITGEKIDVKSTWPRDLRNTLERFGLSRPDLQATPESGGGDDSEA
jgi:23S rRNA pseudouridine1911/1915/1917 synthase